MTHAAVSWKLLPLLLALIGPPAVRDEEPKPVSAERVPLLLGQPRDDYSARRHALMKKIIQAESRRNVSPQPGGELVVVIRGEDDRGKEDFEVGRFRQSNSFAYLTGVEFPGAWLVLLPRQDCATLYLPPRSGHSVQGGEPAHPLASRGSAEELGMEAVEPTSKLLGDLFAAIADPIRGGGGGPKSVVYTLSPNPDRDDTRPEAHWVRFLRQGVPNTIFRDLSPILGEMRKFKTPSELALLQKAIDITGEANVELIRTIRPGVLEYQLQAKIVGAFLHAGSERPGFASIVGSGPNSTIPHYFLGARKMAEGDLVVVDIGAEYSLYTADITRTYPVNGKFTPRQREIYELVWNAQTDAASHMKPGVTRLSEMTGHVSRYLRGSPLRARDQDGEERTMDHFFTHGLGHYLGMDVHDVGDTSLPMQVGEVFTIEPGIYIKSENLGVRIEDDYVMTEDGPRKLSKGITSDPDVIQKKIAEARGVGVEKPPG